MWLLRQQHLGFLSLSSDFHSIRLNAYVHCTAFRAFVTDENGLYILKLTIPGSRKDLIGHRRLAPLGVSTVVRTVEAEAAARKVEAGHLRGSPQRWDRSEDPGRAARAAVRERGAARILRSRRRKLWAAGDRGSLSSLFFRPPHWSDFLSSVSNHSWVLLDKLAKDTSHNYSTVSESFQIKPAVMG